MFARLALRTARLSVPLPSDLPTSLAPQYPYPGKTAFCVHPASCSSYYSCLMFGPSHSNGSGSMASADPCHFNPISQSGLPSSVRWQVSPGKSIDFPCILVPFTALAFDRIGFHCLMPARPALQPLMEFLFIKSQVCRQLPSDFTSQ